MRALPAVAALALALLAGPALAVGDTPEDDAREQAAMLQGPLALSADGQWRLHVDARDVLHRVNLADPSRAQSLALPVPVRVIAASRSGQKVALLVASGCVGRADFGSGPGAAARVDWRPETPPGAAARPWGPLPEAAEGYDWRIGPFESVMAWACGPTAGAVRIALWSGLDATPRVVADEPAKARIVASDGAIGVVSDEARPFQLRVFDAARRRELGTIAVPADNDIVDVTADDDLGLVFVEANDGTGPGARRILAYAVR